MMFFNCKQGFFGTRKIDGRTILESSLGENVIIPENLAPFVPKNVVFLTKFVPKDLNIKRFKSFQKKKLEQKIPYSKREKLNDKKAGIVRTINELKSLRENNEIDIEKFAELMEKYSTKLKMIDTAIEKLAKQ